MVLVGAPPSVDQLCFLDHLLTCIRSLRRSAARVVNRCRCVLLAARSAKKVRRLSENSGNLLTNANARKVTIAGTAMLV